MEKRVYDSYIQILKQELILAMGCTEPIAIAYAGAKARSILGKMPERCTVRCSGNIIKNVKGVVVPQSNGKRGIDVAATLGIVGGDAEQVLDVLSCVRAGDVAEMNQLLARGFCKCELQEGTDNLYIDLTVWAGEEYAQVIISDYHTNIIRVEKNGQIILQEEPHSSKSEAFPNKALLNLKDILAFGDCVKMEDVQSIIERQITCNRAISEEGLKNSWGAQVGRTLLQMSPMEDLKVLSCAVAAAGSDARMAGCALPVVINSGSGNQGITITMPILAHADRYHVDHETVCRALCVANLISVHQKQYIGSLSAYCGAVSAACAAACGVAYMMHESYDVIAHTITNTICTVGGIVCDGAKSSCAAKIAASVNAALTALDMARLERVFQPGEGLTCADVEQTIAMVGCMGREGMKSTDIQILNLMLKNSGHGSPAVQERTPTELA